MLSNNGFTVSIKDSNSFLSGTIKFIDLIIFEFTASVIEAEMDDGYVLLSLRKAVKDKGQNK
mgnify:CR=1 FL=1